MAYSHTRVDLSRVPDGALKATFIHFAEKHNALVDGANEMKHDLDQLSGETPEAKAETYAVLGQIRRLAHYLHSHRFSVTLLSIQAYVLCAILKQFGIRTQQIRQLFDTLIHCLQNAS